MDGMTTVSVREPSTPVRRVKRHWPATVVGAVLATGFLVYALPPYLTFDPATSRVATHPDLPLFYPMLVAHILFGSVAIVTSVLQVWPWLRRTHPAWHRWSGRLYLFAGTLPAGVAVMAVAPFGEFGPVQQWGNTTLAVLWLVTGVCGYRAARGRRFAEHRVWMLRSVALTWSIVANRVWLLVVGAVLSPATLPDGSPDMAQMGQVVGIATWASWVVNLLVVEWWVNRPKRPATGSVRRPGPNG
jgi:hypothetical protein